MYERHHGSNGGRPDKKCMGPSIMNRFGQFLKDEWPYAIVVAYLFFSHVPRTTAVVNSLIGLMLLTTVYSLFKGTIRLPSRSPIVWSFMAFLAALLLSSTLSPYWQESLTPLRREVLPMALCFILLVGWNATRLTIHQRIVGIVGAIVVAYLVRTVFAFADLARQGLHHNVYTINKSQAAFFDYFAVDSTLAFPILLSVILYVNLNRWLKLVLIGLAGLALWLVGISGVRTAVAVIVVVSLLELSPWVWRHKKKAVAMFAALGVAIYLLAGPKLDELTNRYAQVLSVDTYKSDGSMVERYAIWGSILDMVSERPMLGYGLGWQKMYDVAINQGYIEKWTQRNQTLDQWAVRYYKVGRGAANPHNLSIQILFESGLLGLLSYSALLLATLMISLKLCRYVPKDAAVQWFMPTLLCYAVAYFLINLTNGIWLTSGPTLMLICVAELLRQQYEQQYREGARATL